MANSNPTAELAVTYEIDGNTIKLTPKIVQEYLVGSDSQITLAEFKMFTELCKVRKLNPFLREAYCIKYGQQPATIVVGKDVIVNRAISHPMYDGKETGVIVLNENGELVERQGCFVAPNETLVGGWAKIYRKDWKHPEYMSVALEEVKGKKKDGTVNSTWNGKAATMVEKVAKVRALREAFNDELGGMYSAEEFGQTVDAPMPELEKPAEEPKEEIVAEVDIDDL